MTVIHVQARIREFYVPYDVLRLVSKGRSERCNRLEPKTTEIIRLNSTSFQKPTPQWSINLYWSKANQQLRARDVDELLLASVRPSIVVFLDMGTEGFNVGGQFGFGIRESGAAATGDPRTQTEVVS